MADTPKTAKLTIDGADYELPIHSPSAGPDVLDIRKLYGQAGVFTYDPGFTSTASTDSTITYIDGGKGELLHRGYPIDQLAEKSHYLEVCYLLLYGYLPKAEELEDLREHHHPAHHAARADAELLPRVPPGRAPHGDHGGRRGRDGGVLPRLDRYQRPPPA